MENFVKFVLILLAMYLIYYVVIYCISWLSYKAGEYLNPDSTYWLMKKIDKEMEEDKLELKKSMIKSYQTQIYYLNQNTNEVIKELPEILSLAEKYLNDAEYEFREGAFAPFWDRIEVATIQLAKITNAILQISSYPDEYEYLVEELMVYDASPSEPMKIHSSPLPDVSHAGHKLYLLVRKAQKNFQFASIYEQRKTNKLLIEGFSTLGNAIYNIQETLLDSFNHLESTLTDKMDVLSTSIKDVGDTLHNDNVILYNEVKIIKQNIINEINKKNSNSKSKSKSKIKDKESIHHSIEHM